MLGSTLNSNHVKEEDAENAGTPGNGCRKVARLDCRKLRGLTPSATPGRPTARPQSHNQEEVEFRPRAETMARRMLEPVLHGAQISGVHREHRPVCPHRSAPRAGPSLGSADDPAASRGDGLEVATAGFVVRLCPGIGSHPSYEKYTRALRGRGVASHGASPRVLQRHRSAGNRVASGWAGGGRYRSAVSEHARHRTD